MMKRLLLLASVFVLLLTAFSPVAVLADSEIRLRAELKATDEGKDARGEAEWRQQLENNGKVKRTRFRVDVQDVAKDGKGSVTVTRDGAVVFTDEIKIDDGDGRLELDSDDGDDVPKLEAGDVVEVRDSKGVLVLTGTLKKD